MALVHIYHSTNFADSMMYGKASTIWNKGIALEAYHSDVYELAGELDVAPGVDVGVEMTLEYVYMNSQNIEDHWNKAKPCRSTSVGDILQLANKLYIVASCGFDEL